MPQDPAAIQRQIDQTRAELAETVDAIAEMVSPRRVAERANVQIRSRMEELRDWIVPSDGHGPRALEGATAAEGELIRAGGVPGGEPAMEPGETRVVRTVRWDRVALVSIGVLLLVRVSRRRSRKRSH